MFSHILEKSILAQKTKKEDDDGGGGGDGDGDDDMPSKSKVSSKVNAKL